MNYISLKFLLHNVRQIALFTTGMLLAPFAHGAAIPLEDDTPTAQAKHSTPLPSPRLYFSDQGKKLLIIGTQAHPGPGTPKTPGIAATIKAFQPTVALVDESSWPAVRRPNAGNTPLRRYPVLPNNHAFIQQIVNRLHTDERVLVITSASRLREVKPLLEKALSTPTPRGDRLNQSGSPPVPEPALRHAEE